MRTNQWRDVIKLWDTLVEASDRGFRERKISVAEAKEVSRKFC